MPESFANVKAVFEQRDMYSAVVDADYMFHRELVDALGKWAARAIAPLRIIDLGCSDAWVATHGFRTANVESYRGVDISESSIDKARENLAIWSGRAEVVVGNLADVLHAMPAGSATLVLGSYSIHHFSSDAKLVLLREIHRVLASHGTFIWIDAVRRNDESRDEYIDRLTHHMANDWTALTPEQREAAGKHVRESDFPETEAWMMAEIDLAGFARTATVLKTEYFDGWEFTKRQVDDSFGLQSRSL